MKKYSLYRWIGRVVMLSGIPALTMMCNCAKLYGPPPPSEVIIQGENIDTLTTTGENGELRLNNAPSLP